MESEPRDISEAGTALLDYAIRCPGPALRTALPDDLTQFSEVIAAESRRDVAPAGSRSSSSPVGAPNSKLITDS